MPARPPPRNLGARPARPHRRPGPDGFTPSAQILGRYHYKSVPLDDAMSEKIFDRYLQVSRPGTPVLHPGRHRQLRRRPHAARRRDPEGQSQRARSRSSSASSSVTERLTDAREQLARDFDFSVKEGQAYARDKAPWPADDAEVRDLWSKRVKTTGCALLSAGKDDKAIRETPASATTTTSPRATRNKSEDVFQMFMNAHAMSIEPPHQLPGAQRGGRFRHLDAPLAGGHRRGAAGA